MSLKLYIDISVNNNIKSFQLGSAISVSREISTESHSMAFNLPPVSSHPFNYENKFIGDVMQGGSCNVDVLSFCPHNLTHVETSDHILNQNPSHASINKIPTAHLQGLVYVIDLSSIIDPKTKLIQPEHFKNELRKIILPVNAIAFKTRASDIPQDFNFSNQDFLALAQTTSAELVKFSFAGQKITTLLLDLPSTDPENDNGKLLAHRSFFEIPSEGTQFIDSKKKVIVELAYFNNVSQNYFYFILTPARIKTNAMVTDILFYPLIPY